MGKDLFPFFLMVLVQLGSAGTVIISKIVMDDGMNPYVHLSYRQIIATISIAPFAYFCERETRPKLTLSTLFLIFLCSIFGVTGMQMTYLIGLKNSTATITTALANLVPAITFLLAVLSGLEKVGLRSKGGQAKVMGTILCICGAMLLSLYHGKMLIGQLKIHWKYSQHNTSKNIILDPNNNTHGNFFLGPFLVIISGIVYSLWLIIQPRVSERYAAPYSSTTLMCFMASLECTIIALCVNNHDKNAWSLNPIRAISVLYNGIISSALAFYLITWCIKRKGPLYVSVFLPLLLVISAFLSWALLGEKLYVGTIVGSMLTVIGLYGFLWGKKKEMERIKKETEEKPKVNERYAAPYSSTTLMCFMASLECTIVALFVNHRDKNAWSLNPIRAISVLYNGIISSALAFYLITWCIKRKGPLYVSVFLPLLLVIAAFLSWTLLGEKLYVGTIMGSMLTVIGLYGFLWGKKKEMEQIKEETDLELQFSENSNQRFTNK
ncbi:hypothetical protein H5410_011144 [Solanum commersonii]|uniref:EamA domain-containing protein n=1 Tax=Solanum commersonii TaxID=4109 RepID=A0A9J6AMU1_SOLCO|nr:hypothetical protein H5410_011144 [Solanum commersonii]